MILKPTPPRNEAELLSRCLSLAGMTWAELAETYHQTLPQSLTQAKGFVGQLLEYVLGATAHNQAKPDFVDLAIELKTIPVNRNGTPKESTYVCTVPLNFQATQENWQTSWVKQKLNRVLWVPFEADPSIPLNKRRLGAGLLWSPDPKSEAILQQDWEELMCMIQLGYFSKLSAKIGTYLHIRPKAANSQIVTKAINEQGEPVQINPKGFYLRSHFTKKILSEHYCYG